MRAVIVEGGRLLLVNAYPGGRSDLWCAPGGGAEAGLSLPDNLAREVWEETGLRVRAGGLLAVNEFHDPASGFHQVDLFFAARIVGGALDTGWQDPAQVVSERRFFTPAELSAIRLKPDMLPDLAFGPRGPARYDPLEVIVP